MSTREVTLDGGSPWGFRMHGGADVGQPLRISRVNPGSKAAQKGVREGDVISSINGQSTKLLSNSDAHSLLRNAGQTLRLGLNEECSGSPKRRLYKPNISVDGKADSTKRTSSKPTPNGSIGGTTTTVSTTTTTVATNGVKNDKGDVSEERNGILKNKNPPNSNSTQGGTTSKPVQDKVWTPSQKPEEISEKKEQHQQQNQQEKQEGKDAQDASPIWTPKSGASPTTERKGFRPVNFETAIPKKARSELFQESKSVPVPEESFAWQSKEGGSPLKSPSSDRSAASSAISSSLDKHLTQGSSATFASTGPNFSSRLPRAQNPTITLLQKAREGQLPRGALYLDHKMNSKEDDKPLIGPNEVVYTVKHEYESEDEEKPRKIVELGPRKYEGIGPTTRDGIPVGLRTGIKEENQAKWYKKMYDSLHKSGKDGQYPYSSAGGYVSEPEHMGYDSDIGYSAKYATLDRRRIKNKDYDFTTSTLPRSKYVPASAKYDVYKNQPGKIEDYEPGHSSIAEKEAKMPSERPNPPQSKPFMQYALKESGYESDSTLVFKRREENMQNLSPSEQKVAYKSIQKGGEVPLHGLRKSAPERPKDDSNIEYFPISPHLTRIHVHRQHISPQREILCYPVSVPPPPPLFSTFKRTAPSLAPSPPKRNSSLHSSTLQRWSRMMSDGSSTRGSRSNVRCRSWPLRRPVGKEDVDYPKSTLNRKLASENRLTCRSPSLHAASSYSTLTSPCRSMSPLQSGRRFPVGKRETPEGSSRKQRSMIVQKEPLNKCSDLTAPSEVKKVLQKQKERLQKTSVHDHRTLPSKSSIPPGTLIRSSTTLFASARNSRKHPIHLEDKSLRVTVAISPKGRELLRSSRTSTAISKMASRSSPNSRNSEKTTLEQGSARLRGKSKAIPPLDSKRLCTRTTCTSPKAKANKEEERRAKKLESQVLLEKECRKRPREKIIKTAIVKKINKPPAGKEDKANEAAMKKRIRKPKAETQVPSYPQEVKKVIRKTNGSKAVPLPSNARSAMHRKPGTKAGSLLGKRTMVEQENKPTTSTCSLDMSVPSSETGYSSSLDLSHSPLPAGRPLRDISNHEYRGAGFFQNLLLSDMKFQLPRSSAILDRARPFETKPLYYKSEPLCYKSEPLLNVYLTQRRMVSESKFRAMEQELLQNQSLSCTRHPPQRSHSFHCRVSRSDNFGSNQPEFTSSNDQNERYLCPAKERSTSEPPCLRASKGFAVEHTPSTELRMKRSPQKIIHSPSPSPTHHGIRRHASSKNLSQVQSSSSESLPKKSSQGFTEKSRGEMHQRSRSTSSLSNITDYSDYQSYVLELLHSTKKSEHFQKLHKFYTSLEKMGKLEKTASSIDLHRQRGEEIIDFDRWKQLRTKEKAEEELQKIYQKLKEAQKEKQFLFRSKDVDAVKWRGDRGLRWKEKSVEDLREHFSKLSVEESELQLNRRRELEARKDVYKPLWRGSSVANLASNYSTIGLRRPSSRTGTQAFSRYLSSIPYRDTRSKGRLWSSLSLDQVNALKSQLNEIYGSMNNIKTWRERKAFRDSSKSPALSTERHVRHEHQRYEISIPPDPGIPPQYADDHLYVRCHSLLGRDQLYSPIMKRKEARRTESMKADSISSLPHKEHVEGRAPKCKITRSESEKLPSRTPVKMLSEMEKKRLSMTLSQEILDRVMKQRSEFRKGPVIARGGRETHGAAAVAAAAISSATLPRRLQAPSPSPSPVQSETSPRTCYSLEMSDDSDQRASVMSQQSGKNDFLLVLAPTESAQDPRTRSEVERTVQEWANGAKQKDLSSARAVPAAVRTRAFSNRTSTSETESISSETSTKTVIYRDVLAKVEYFEKKLAENQQMSYDRGRSRYKVCRSASDVNSFYKPSSNAALYLSRTRSAPSRFSSLSNRNDFLKYHENKPPIETVPKDYHDRVRVTASSPSRLSLSQSFSDIKEIFGERSGYATLPFPSKKRSSPPAAYLSPKYLPEKSVSSIDLSTENLPQTSGNPQRKITQTYTPNSSRGNSPIGRPLRRAQTYTPSSSRGNSPIGRPLRRLNSSESLYSMRQYSRSPSPDPNKYWRSYLNMVKVGDVRRLRHKFESLEELVLTGRQEHRWWSDKPPRYRSDPEIAREYLFRRKGDSTRTVIKGQEAGDVQWLRRRYENTRSPTKPPQPLSEIRRTLSPVSRVRIRAEDRFMSHINIISKIAALQRRSSGLRHDRGIERLLHRDYLQREYLRRCPSGDVDRIRYKFETLDLEGRISLLGQMFTSTPDLTELKDIAPFISWARHFDSSRSPSPLRMRSLSPALRHQSPSPTRIGKLSSRSRSPSASGPSSLLRGRPSGMESPTSRSRSSPQLHRDFVQTSTRPRPMSTSPSPTRYPPSILKNTGGDKFSNQHFDPTIHRPKYRYLPAEPPAETQSYYRPWTRELWRSFPSRPLPPTQASAHVWCPSYDYRLRSNTPSRTVTFKEPVIGPVPIPKPRNSYRRDWAQESPHKYAESEVTIHYRSPIRAQVKEAVSEEELARRQEEAMRRIYQEERRRKYLQELQDMESRRHTDNFTPSQKSPIPLNRYDDFLEDVPKTKPRDRTPEPKMVARALYNFVGQSSRELSFRRGDIIFVRRQVDKNWYEGEHNAMIGLFPFNYVEIIPYDGVRTTPKRPSEGQARAKFNFVAQTHLELSLIKGELVVLTQRVDDNWFEGRIGNRKGIFPVSYVDVLVEPGERPVTPAGPVTKPIGSPASHALMMNGSIQTTQNPSYYNQKLSYTSPYSSLTRHGYSSNQLAPVNQTLHIDTRSEPVPYRALYNYKPQNDDELELCEGDTVYVMEKCDDGWYVGSSQRTGYFGTFPGNYVERI